MAELDGRPATAAQLQALALTNYGHFTTMLVEDGLVRGLGLHLARLERDCRELFGADLDLERVRAYARRAAPTAGAATVRVTVFDPELDLGRIGGAASPRVLVTTRPAGPAELPPLRVRTVRYERDAPHVKGVGLFGALRERRAAQAAGYDDALFTDASGAVSEGGTWNIGFVRGGEVLWPTADQLRGTTMELLQAAHPWRALRITGAAGFEAAFATNAAVGVRPVAAVDGTDLAVAHPVVAALRAAYAAVRGERL
ncbi:aminotransferase class IV [Kitasatospora arboriphila]|uniref:Aminotransferase class IV family protein n=1 Tax=Kitasatospora arboriphila TaxID=258052 RepID=A0ABP4DXH3_9ACTN